MTATWQIRSGNQLLHQILVNQGVVDVSLAPAHDFVEHRLQRSTFLRRRIAHAQAMAAVWGFLNQSGALKLVQSVGQDAGRYFLRRSEKLLEFCFIEKQKIAQNNQRPLVANQVENTRYGAVGSSVH